MATLRQLLDRLPGNMIVTDPRARNPQSVADFLDQAANTKNCYHIYWSPSRRVGVIAQERTLRYRVFHPDVDVRRYQEHVDRLLTDKL